MHHSKIQKPSKHIAQGKQQLKFESALGTEIKVTQMDDGWNVRQTNEFQFHELCSHSQADLNAEPSAQDMWSFKTGSLPWQYVVSQDRFYC